VNSPTGIFKNLNAFLEKDLQDEILKVGKIIKADKGAVLIKEGQYLDFLPIVISGKIRVYQQREGREILLYHVTSGQTCMMSLSSAYFDYNSAATGATIEPTEILILPASVISGWQLKYPSWNRFIINTFKSRYDELLSSFGNVAFKPIHIRAVQYLEDQAKAGNSKKIVISHQTLANELGTTRVVVSRILKQFEKEKKLKLHRGYIQLA
jgi:CRP/FNR family transcriptional regulator